MYLGNIVVHIGRPNLRRNDYSEEPASRYRRRLAMNAPHLVSKFTGYITLRSDGKSRSP